MSEERDELAKQLRNAALDRDSAQQEAANQQRRAEKAERALTAVQSQLGLMVDARDTLAETVRRLKDEKRLLVDGVRAVCAAMMAAADLERAWQLQIGGASIREWAVSLEEAIGKAEPPDT